MDRSEYAELSVACKTCMEAWKELRPESTVQERAVYAYNLGLRHVGKRHKMDFDPGPGPMLRYCPRCGAVPEYGCTTADGRPVGGFHIGRRRGDLVIERRNEEALRKVDQ